MVDFPNVGSADVAIFWDFENVRIPAWCATSMATERIRNKVAKYGRIVEKRLYYDSRQPAESTAPRSELDLSGFTLVDCPSRNRKETCDKKLIVDVLCFAWERAARGAKACVVLITSDGDYSYALARLRDIGVFTVIIYRPNIVAQVLIDNANDALSWDFDVLEGPPQVEEQAQHVFVENDMLNVVRRLSNGPGINNTVKEDDIVQRLLNEPSKYQTIDNHIKKQRDTVDVLDIELGGGKIDYEAPSKDDAVCNISKESREGFETNDNCPNKDDVVCVPYNQSVEGQTNDDDARHDDDDDVICGLYNATGERQTKHNIANEGAVLGRRANESHESEANNYNTKEGDAVPRPSKESAKGQTNGNPVTKSGCVGSLSNEPGQGHNTNNDLNEGNVELRLSHESGKCQTKENNNVNNIHRLSNDSSKAQTRGYPDEGHVDVAKQLITLDNDEKLALFLNLVLNAQKKKKKCIGALVDTQIKNNVDDIRFWADEGGVTSIFYASVGEKDRKGYLRVRSTATEKGFIQWGRRNLCLPEKPVIKVIDRADKGDGMSSETYLRLTFSAIALLRPSITVKDNDWTIVLPKAKICQLHEAKPPASNQTPTAIKNGKLFVGGLAWQTTQDSLRSYFKQFGHIEHAFVMKGKGFGFVVFKCHQDAEKAITKACQHIVDNKSVDVKPFTK